MHYQLVPESLQKIETVDVIELHSEYLKLHETNREIFDGFSYAAAIQQGLLPQQRHFDRLFKEYFVMYQPLNMIGGDFYWISEKNDSVIFAVGDCTGHGIPGAMLSMLGISFMNYVVLGKNMDDLGKILEEVDKKWIETFNKFEESGVNNDWLEVSLASFNRKTRELKFAGAEGKIIIAGENKTELIRGSRYPIGGWQIASERNYKEHSIILEENTMVYMASDGFHHQIGGEKNKKLSGKRMFDFLSEIFYLPANVQKSFLEMAFNEWKGKNQQTDDVCMLGVKL